MIFNCALYTNIHVNNDKNVGLLNTVLESCPHMTWKGKSCNQNVHSKSI